MGFDTTSRNSNLELIEFVQDYLDGLGIASGLVFDATAAKANLLATIGPPDHPESCCPATRTWCRWTVRTGRASRLPASSATAACTGAAPPT